jgi:hypothetical protein
LEKQLLAAQLDVEKDQNSTFLDTFNQDLDSEAHL